MIELTKARYGPGCYQEPGTKIELDENEERALVNAGRAKRVETPESKRTLETAAIQTPQRRGKRR